MKDHSCNNEDWLKPKWYIVIAVWELLRIPFNIVMYFIGYLSFYISYVTIPLVYIFIGFLLNILYTGTWIIELSYTNKLAINDRRTMFRIWTFIIVIFVSAGFIFLFALFPLL